MNTFFLISAAPCIVCVHGVCIGFKPVQEFLSPQFDSHLVSSFWEVRQPYAHTPAEDIRREIETSVNGNEDMSGDGLKDLISTERISQLIVVVVRTKSFVEIDLAHFDVESIMLVKYCTLTPVSYTHLHNSVVWNCYGGRL